MMEYCIAWLGTTQLKLLLVVVLPSWDILSKSCAINLKCSQSDLVDTHPAKKAQLTLKMRFENLQEKLALKIFGHPGVPLKA